MTAVTVNKILNCQHEPVAAARRQSPASVTAVWFDFPMFLTNTVLGGVAGSNKLHNVKRELAQ
jgi:hypothetical protein